jgi:hypothetical protein
LKASAEKKRKCDKPPYFSDVVLFFCENGVIKSDIFTPINGAGHRENDANSNLSVFHPTNRPVYLNF